MPRITPNLWFDTESEEAAEFYVSVFPNSEIRRVTYYGEAGPRPAGTVLTVDFVLDGQEYTAINGGPQFTFDEAISLLINCADQAEIDYYWTTLSEGGEEGPCGWLKDRYGLSWQVVPAGWGELLSDPDKGRAQRAMAAVLGMKKIDVAAVYAAADHVPYDLDRFLVEQQHVYEGVLEELRRGRKTGHWIWFIFPQVAGLGHSATSQRFAITSLDEARAYLAHPVLGARLRECAGVVLATRGRTAEEIFGSTDAMKVRSCMTLFHRAAPDAPVFAQVLDRYYGGVADEATDARLG